MIEVTAEAMIEYKFHRTTKGFYLRDISKSDSIQEIQGKGLAVQTKRKKKTAVCYDGSFMTIRNM